MYDMQIRIMNSQGSCECIANRLIDGLPNTSGGDTISISHRSRTALDYRDRILFCCSVKFISNLIRMVWNWNMNIFLNTGPAVKLLEFCLVL